MIHLVFSQGGLEKCLAAAAEGDTVVAMDGRQRPEGCSINYLIFIDKNDKHGGVDAVGLLDLLRRSPCVSWY